MSIPAAESWDVVREAALAFRQWRIRHFGCRAGQLRASTDRDSSLLSDPAQTPGPKAPADGHLR